MPTSYTNSHSSPSRPVNIPNTDSDNDTPLAHRSPDLHSSPDIVYAGKSHVSIDDGGSRHFQQYPPSSYQSSHDIDQSLSHGHSHGYSRSHQYSNGTTAPYGQYHHVYSSIPEDPDHDHDHDRAISPSSSDRRRLSSVESDSLSTYSAPSPTQTLQTMAVQAMSASSLQPIPRDYSARAGSYSVPHYVRTSSLSSTAPLPIPVRGFESRHMSLQSGSPILNVNVPHDTLPSPHSMPVGHSSSHINSHSHRHSRSRGAPSKRESLPSIHDLFGDDQLYPLAPAVSSSSSRPRGSFAESAASPISPSLYGTSPHNLPLPPSMQSYQLSSSHHSSYTHDPRALADSNTAAMLAMDVHDRMRLTSPSAHSASSASASASGMKQNEFRCPIEGCKTQPFSTQYLLNSHMNVHSSSRPHYCPYAGCPRAEGGEGFKRKNEMVRHSHIHMSPRYVCPFCPDQDRKYPRPDNLQRHVRTRHSEKSLDDPALREVLSQRPDGNKKGRRRRTGP